MSWYNHKDFALFNAVNDVNSEPWSLAENDAGFDTGNVDLLDRSRYGNSQGEFLSHLRYSISLVPSLSPLYMLPLARHNIYQDLL